MHAGISELYKYQMTYCSFLVLYNECKWWQFARKKTIREQLDWIYPLMVSESKALGR